MTTLRTATDIKILWNENDSSQDSGWYVRYTDNHGCACDESMGCDADAFAERDELIAMAARTLAYAGFEAADLDVAYIED